ncbi:MAG: Ig-like domain-containing protein, partial [Pseudomonadota bacterium]
SSDIDIGAGPGVTRVLLVGGSGTTITATAVDDALVEGDETGVVTIELGGTLDPNFTLNPTDVSIRLVDSDANNPAEGVYTLLSESFETDGNGIRYTTSIDEFTDFGSSTGEDFFLRTDGSDVSVNYQVSGADGSYFFAGQDIDAANVAGNGGPPEGVITFTAIDVSEYENLTFSALFAEDDDSIFQDIDTVDGIRVRAQLDGGGFVDILGFEAGGDQGNEVAQLDTNLNGIGDGAALTDTFTRYSADIAGTGTLLDIEIELDAGFSQEDFAIDDIQIAGDRIADFDVLTTGFVDIFEGGQTDTVIARIAGTPDAGDDIDLVATWNPADYRVNGNATGSLTISFSGSDFLAQPDGEIEEIITLTAVDDGLDELLDQGISQYLTLDVVSADDVGMDALGPTTVTGVRVWDNDGDTGAGPDGAFVLHQEGFETDGAGIRYTLSRVEFNNQNSGFGGDWFTRSTGGSDLERGDPGDETFGITGGSEGSWFFAVQDPNGATSGPNVESLTISGIDINGFTNLHLDMDLVEDDQDDGLEDWNGSTFFSVEARIDGGAWAEVMRIEGTDQTDHEPGQDTDFDAERDGQALSEIWTEFGGDIIGTGEDLDIRLTWNDFLFSGEDISVDDIRVTGDAEPNFTITGDYFAFGNFIADASYGVVDGVNDFDGNSSFSTFDIVMVGANSASEFVLGDVARFVQTGSSQLALNLELTVTATNVEDGFVMLEGEDLDPFALDALVLLDQSFGNNVPLTLEIGPSTPPVLLSTNPSDNSTGVPLFSNIVLNFNETVVAGAGVIELRRVSDNSLVDSFAVTGSEVNFAGSSVTVNPVPLLPSGDDLYVNITPGAIRDLAGNPYVGIADSTTFNFATNIAPVVNDSIISVAPLTNESHFFTAFDAEGDPLTFTLASGSAFGTMNLLSNGNFNFGAGTVQGMDFLTYNVSDGNGNTTTALVDVTVIDVNTNQILAGTNGNDIIGGGNSDDSIAGLQGSDLLLVQSGGIDFYDGGSGNDTIEAVGGVLV